MRLREDLLYKLKIQTSNLKMKIENIKFKTIPSFLRSQERWYAIILIFDFEF